jgi:hypothetical protein
MRGVVVARTAATPDLIIFAMIAPVLMLGIVSAGIYAWMFLGVFILSGSGLIWWATERAWGKFS